MGIKVTSNRGKGVDIPIEQKVLVITLTESEADILRSALVKELHPYTTKMKNPALGKALCVMLGCTSDSCMDSRIIEKVKKGME